MIFKKPKNRRRAVVSGEKAPPAARAAKPPEEPKKEEKRERLDWIKEFLTIFDKLTYRHRAYDVWRDFVTMAACAISNSLDKEHFDEREKMYLKTIGKYAKSEQSVFPQLMAITTMALDDNPEQDFLGEMYMRLNLGNRSTSQFFTPYHICDVMAKTTAGDNIAEVVDKQGCFSVCDPCCGAGATLIAGINEARRQLEDANLNFQNHILVVGQDIDLTVALMCYIQISLLGVAGYI